MAQMTILDQQSTINRTNKFIERYGIAKKWMAVKVQIPLQKFSYFCNGRFALSEPEFNRLTDFLNEYDRRMVGFMALEK